MCGRGLLIATAFFIILAEVRGSSGGGGSGGGDGGGNRRQSRDAPEPVDELPVITVSKVFANANAAPVPGPANQSDWFKRLHWIPQKDIKIVRFIDSGRFSNVFEASLSMATASSWQQPGQDDDAVYWSTHTTPAPTTAILKVLKHTFFGKVKREIRILELLKDVPGIVRLLGASKNTACHPKTISLLFEHLPDTQWLSHLHLPVAENAGAVGVGAGAIEAGGPAKDPNPWTLLEIRLFVYKLLRALLECHRRGIMHRDVKPRNIICQRQTRELRLIDFGLSEMYHPRGKYNPSVASRHYKCPELLVEYNYYDYGVDIWAAGCILAGLVFDCEPFFYGANISDQIHVIASVLGSKALLDWARRYNIKLTATMRRAVGKHPAVPLKSFINAKNAALCPPEALDLLSKMLCIDHQERATAEVCLSHAFFDPVRER